MRKNSKKILTVIIYDSYPALVLADGTLQGPCSLVRSTYHNVRTLDEVERIAYAHNVRPYESGSLKIAIV